MNPHEPEEDGHSPELLIIFILIILTIVYLYLTP